MSLLTVAFSASADSFPIRPMDRNLAAQSVKVLWGRPASAIEAADLDGDGFTDIAAMSVSSNEPTADIDLFIAWGSAKTPWTKVTQFPMGHFLRVYSATRDTSSRVIAIGDWDGNGLPDVLTSRGVLMNQGKRKFTMVAMATPTSDILLPVALAKFAGPRPSLVRGRVDGRIEICETPTKCQVLTATGIETYYVKDMVVADFDRDGKPDILAGLRHDDHMNSYLWLSSNRWIKPSVIANMGPVDYQVGDVNKDGLLDIVAQRTESISDFPSYTDLWLGDGRGNFAVGQTIYNHDNHNDAAYLADYNKDGCLDYLQIGVDIPSVGLRLGNCRYLGDHDPTRPSDAGWQQVPATGGIGVQCLDLNRNGSCDLIVRSVGGYEVGLTVILR
ncbi:MAG: hypothetical protein A2070_10135 [Bdellovibrionales bacterium GWC1_52_8]|nr:MAG: hypothetical protein A2Z97_14105 [Bdellovibrionales bacterium GWB1_52_6]OFZ06492.1 MAG: hypothetical protein A2X97_16875 [Bdellovibrionales bacterium GWA1_52_35]OFZ33109.1 MAG: hypothetical protein A2070_10135 [Bdellovibrionales bacterium GWC1_52_8]